MATAMETAPWRTAASRSADGTSRGGYGLEAGADDIIASSGTSRVQGGCPARDGAWPRGLGGRAATMIKSMLPGADQRPDDTAARANQ